MLLIDTPVDKSKPEPHRPPGSRSLCHLRNASVSQLPLLGNSGNEDPTLLIGCLTEFTHVCMHTHTYIVSVTWMAHKCLLL